MNARDVWCVVPAAGRGSRVGGDRPKQYLPLAGRMLIEHTLERLARHPRVAGLVVVNASVVSQDRRLMLLPVLQHVVPSLPGIGSDIKRAGATELAYDRVPLRSLASLRKAWSTVRRDLHRIECPVLHYRSRTDHVVEPRSGQLLRSGIRDVHEVVLEESYHVATLDNDATTIFTGSVDFLRQYSRSTAG